MTDPSDERCCTFTPHQIELRGFSRSLAELEWLLLALTLLYSQVPGARVDDPHGLIFAMIGFALFVLGFRFLNFHLRESRWKLALETWAMIAFLSWVLWHTGKVDSLLLNAYLLVIIACALTLGKLMTLLEVALICTFYLYMGYALHGEALFSLATLSELMARFAPFLLVAYLTTMLAADIQYAKRMLKSQSERDELTGLLNMRGFNELLSREHLKARRYRRPFAVMMVDADNLKGINDSYGHEAGNRLIRLVADTVRGALRSADVLARYGGDEFIVLLPETDAGQLAAVAERIRTAVANSAVDQEGSRLAATVSIGAAAGGQGEEEPQALLHKADLALYESKRQGRNRATLYSEGMGGG